MSSQIRFRAWGHLAEGDYQMFHEFSRFDEYFVPWHDEKPIFDHTLMQFTGLKDVEGLEIYEGDIVEFTYWWFDGNDVESTLSGEIIYLPDCMSFGLKGVKNAEWLRHIGSEPDESDTAAFATWLFDEADFHVFGNRFEHPKLLEQ